jgi:hypothetical protein
MRRVREILFGSLPLLAPLSVGIPAEILPGSRNEDSVRISGARTVEVRDPVPPAPRGDLLLGAEIRPASTSAEPAQPTDDCWIVEEYYVVLEGHRFHCTKWLCDDGRTWTECDPV